MRKFILTALAVLLLPGGAVFSQGSVDNLYGDYLLFNTDKIISLDLEGAQLLDVLKLLSRQTGLNFISTEVIQARALTLYLKEVPLKEAMDIIFKANNLTYEYYPEGNVFVIKELGKPTIESRTKVFYLENALVGSSRLANEIGSALGECGSSAGGLAAAGGIKEAVSKVLSDYGKVDEDPLTNSLIVTDVPSQFPVIEKLIAELDVALPQVMIEVEMLDVSTRSVDKLGVSWPETIANLDMAGTRVTSFPFDGHHRPHVERATWAEFESPGGADFSGWPAHDFTPSVFTLVGAELALDFLRTQTDTKFLARPKILTLSHESAEIKITTDEAISVTKTESDSTTEYTIERAETGVKLRVTPQVNERTGEVVLLVETVVAEAKDSGFATVGFVSGTIKDPEERATKAVLRLKDGQTLLLGGLIKHESSDAGTKVPILNKIPLIGRFFKHEHEDVRERELLVFLTPRIIKSKPLFSTGSRVVCREQDNPLKRASVTVALDRLSKSK